MVRIQNMNATTLSMLVCGYSKTSKEARHGTRACRYNTSKNTTPVSAGTGKCSTCGTDKLGVVCPALSCVVVVSDSTFSPLLFEDHNDRYMYVP